ncbi:MAG: Flp pilus assembly protein CpaB, partial [Polyangiales bacterium]
GPRTSVLVLLEDAKAGTTLSSKLLGLREMPQAYLESRHVAARDVDQVEGAVLGVAAHANETLLWTDLASMREPPRTLSSLVPDGMRAFALQLRDGSFDSLLAPGDRVDVLLATSPRASGEPSANVETVAQSLLVLAVGEDLGGHDQRRARTPSRSNRVTVSVTPAEGAQLAEAERRGSLRLFVRNPDDVAMTGQPPTEPTVTAANAPERN